MIEAKQGQHRDSKMYSQLIKILSQCFQIPVLNFKNYIFSLQQDVEKCKLSQEVEVHQPLNVKFVSMMETWSNLLVTVLVPLVWFMSLVWKHGCQKVTHESANFASSILMFISGTEHFQRFVINCTMNPKGFIIYFFHFFSGSRVWTSDKINHSAIYYGRSYFFLRLSSSSSFISIRKNPVVFYLS